MHYAFGGVYKQFAIQVVRLMLKYSCEKPPGLDLRWLAVLIEAAYHEALCTLYIAPFARDAEAPFFKNGFFFAQFFYLRIKDRVKFCAALGVRHFSNKNFHVEPDLVCRKANA